MNKKMNKAYIPAILVLASLALFHFLGNDLYFYVRYPGYDVMMHLLGGVGVALACYWVEVTFFKSTFIEKYLWTIILFTLIGGFVWELFEAYYNIAGATVGSHAYAIDTMKDLIDDTLGALIVFLIFKKK